MGHGDTHMIERVLYLIPLILSLSVHEWAHAWSAHKLGDDTAQRVGRLTLNPLAHVDFIGTIMLPLLGIPFGWAKPVPVNPARFRRGVNMWTGMMITAAAGPLSNIVLAIICTVVYALSVKANPNLADDVGPFKLLAIGMGMNVILAIFNMLPIPPLDGSRIADWLMPRRLRPAWESFSRYGGIALLVVIFTPQLFGFSIIEWPYRQTMQLLFKLALAIINA